MIFAEDSQRDHHYAARNNCVRHENINKNNNRYS